MDDRKKKSKPSAGRATSAANPNADKLGPSVDPVAENDSEDISDRPTNDAVENDLSNEAKDRKLYKSPRFTWYLIMFLSSIINYHGILVSQVSTDVHVIVSTGTQRQYGYVAAIVSCITSGFCVFCHLDGCSCLADTWKSNLYAHKSKFETILGFCLLIWWFMAVVIETRCYGIAGDGKGQYNIYFSTWCCFFCAVSIVQSKMMEHEWPSIKTFIKSWPYRAPGWIAILVCDFFTLFWYVDIYTTYDLTVRESEQINARLVSYYESINDLQIELLILVAAATLLPSCGFVFMEIFRNSYEEKKSSAETYVEAFSLLALACLWIPGVCVVTTPGGFAAQIGNSWFFTWGTCFFVVETLLWFVSDSRGGLHQTLVEKEQEYQQHQLNVLAAAHEMQDDLHENQQQSDEGEDEMDNRMRTSVDDGASETSEPVDDIVAYEMKDISENEDSLDDSIKQEMRMKETNRAAYFDTLDDILE